MINPILGIDTWEGQLEIDEAVLKANKGMNDILRTNNLYSNPRNVEAFGGVTKAHGGASMFNMLSQKRCSKCGEWKNKSEFNKNKRYSDGYQSYCKDCMSAYSKKWSEDNPDKRKSITNKWRSNNKSLLVLLARTWNVLNPERKREINRNWNKNHPKQVRMMEKKRDALERNAPGLGITEKEWEQLKADYHYLCGYCGKKLPLELDHIIPLSKGGADEIENAIPACRTCNASKSNNPLIIFLSRRGK